ncbi:MAG: hypothetical protein IT379_25660 [Deltaproteobacteria bacterium]|nr:hypothetical protein [Deltaproteobacteria bacterium]
MRIAGPLDRLRLEVLEQAIEIARARRQGLIVELDSPGGDLEVGRQMLLRIALAPVPVVIVVPSGGEVAGAALFPLLAASIVSIASDARVGTETGLGPDPTERLGSFGSRVLAAAREDRSAAIDWLVVSLAEGSVIDGRGARARGLSELEAPDAVSAAQRLAGSHVDVVLTGEPRRVLGPEARIELELPTSVAMHVRTPFVTTLLAVAGMLVIALGLATGGAPLVVAAGVVAVGVAVAGPHALPIEPLAFLPLSVGAWLATSAATWLDRSRAGAAVAVVAGALGLAVGADLLVAPLRAGWYTSGAGEVGSLESAALALVSMLPAVAWTRLSARRARRDAPAPLRDEAAAGPSAPAP